ncbi:MAG: hypothetical protein WDN72_08130 [Alphaproteobacteria bacterium]
MYLAANAIVTGGAGNVTVYADSLNFAAAAISAAGSLTLAPYSNLGVSVGANVASTINYSNAFLTSGEVSAASYIFGSATTPAPGRPIPATLPSTPTMISATTP